MCTCEAHKVAYATDKYFICNVPHVHNFCQDLTLRLRSPMNASRSPTHMESVTYSSLNTKFLLHLLPFGWNSNVKLWIPNSTSALGLLGLTQRGQKWYQSIYGPHSYSTSMHTIGLSDLPFNVKGIVAVGRWAQNSQGLRVPIVTLLLSYTLY